MRPKKKKICFAASSGGHYEQLMMLAPMMALEQVEGFVLTERTDYGVATTHKSYYLCQINRKEPLRYLKLLWNALCSVWIFAKERPDAVICTGVLSMIPICLLAKLFGRKLIYIESFAKVTTPTETGKLLYRFADQFYVQWEPMLAIYPNAIYLGGIY